MSVTRIHLNPEQAVLSCCNGVSKDEVSAPKQCLADAGFACAGTPHNLSAS